MQCKYTVIIPIFRRTDRISFEAFILSRICELHSLDGEGVVVGASFTVDAVFGRIHLGIVQFQSERNHFVYVVFNRQVAREGGGLEKVARFVIH